MKNDNVVELFFCDGNETENVSGGAYQPGRNILIFYNYVKS